MALYNFQHLNILIEPYSCDECIVKDDNDKFVHLHQTDKELDTNVLTKIQSEFDKFVAYYQLDKYGWEYFRHLLVEHVVCIV